MLADNTVPSSYVSTIKIKISISFLFHASDQSVVYDRRTRRAEMWVSFVLGESPWRFSVGFRTIVERFLKRFSDTLYTNVARVAGRTGRRESNTRRLVLRWGRKTRPASSFGAGRLKYYRNTIAYHDCALKIRSSSVRLSTRERPSRRHHIGRSFFRKPFQPPPSR